MTHSGTHVYISSYACASPSLARYSPATHTIPMLHSSRGAACGRSGALSYGTSHSNGDYFNHLGTQATHDAHTDVTAHHKTDSVAATGGSSNTNILSSRLGQDSFIYKISETGEPVSVYAMDTVPSDGNLEGTGVNGEVSYSYINTIDSFDLSADTDKMAIGGIIRGTIKFPKADGTTLELTNQKNSGGTGS